MFSNKIYLNPNPLQPLQASSKTFSVKAPTRQGTAISQINEKFELPLIQAAIIRQTDTASLRARQPQRSNLSMQDSVKRVPIKALQRFEKAPEPPQVCVQGREIFHKSPKRSAKMSANPRSESDQPKVKSQSQQGQTRRLVSKKHDGKKKKAGFKQARYSLKAGSKDNIFSKVVNTANFQSSTKKTVNSILSDQDMFSTNFTHNPKTPLKNSPHKLSSPVRKQITMTAQKPQITAINSMNTLWTFPKTENYQNNTILKNLCREKAKKLIEELQVFHHEYHPESKAKLFTPFFLKERVFNFRPQLKQCQSQLQVNSRYKTPLKQAPKLERPEALKFQKLIEEVKEPMNFPLLSSKSWAVFNSSKVRFFCGKDENTQREMASITKVMTCLLTCKLCEQYEISPQNTYLEISDFSAAQIGTSATLQSGCLISIQDILRGLMMPSGNDAAICLAENFGLLLAMRNIKKKRKGLSDEKDFENCVKQDTVKVFVAEMNAMASQLNMKKTNYTVPHGLADRSNRSTAFELAMLCAHALKNPLFAEIVQTQKYEGRMWCKESKKTIFQLWQNSNRLLEQGFEGVKTGVTTTAGPCLSEAFTLKGVQYTFVLLNCKSMDLRWAEAIQLLQYVASQNL